MDTLNLVLFGVLCFYVGWAAHSFVFRITVIPVLKELGVTDEHLQKLTKNLKQKQQKDADTRPEITIRVEEYDGLLYAYRRDNQQYLCRAKTADLLREELASIIPNGHKVTILKDEGAEFFKNS